MDAKEIIRLLGGVTATARLLGIKPPSVVAWATSGIPYGRKIELAAVIEQKSQGAITRKQMFPDTWQQIWPELAAAEKTEA